MAAAARARIQPAEATGPTKAALEPKTSQAMPTGSGGAGWRRRMVRVNGSAVGIAPGQYTFRPHITFPATYAVWRAWHRRTGFNNQLTCGYRWFPCCGRPAQNSALGSHPPAQNLAAAHQPRTWTCLVQLPVLPGCAGWRPTPTAIAGQTTRGTRPQARQQAATQMQHAQVTLAGHAEIRPVRP